MANRNYTATGKPAFNTPGASKYIRDEFASVSQGVAGLETEIDDRIKVSAPNTPDLPVYASNAEALAGGLTAGNWYRQGDFIAVVH